MKMPFSEIVDRFTITKLKYQRTEEDVRAELDAYSDEIKPYYTKHKQSYIDDFIDRLYEANGKIWDTEGAIRRGEDLSLEEIGRLALKVRDLNCERNAIKAEIVDKFSEGFKELKINYTKVDYGRE